MKLKEIKTKYDMLEMLEISDSLFPKIFGLYKRSKAIIRFGERNVLSVRDYDDTHTTSIVLEKE